MKNSIHALLVSFAGKGLLLALMLVVSCNPNEVKEEQRTTLYHIGDIGPAGGLIFYDKGDETDGWRYLEAAPYDIDTKEWGIFDKEVASSKGAAIGTGMQNTEAIIAFHDNLPNFYSNPGKYNTFSDGTVAAKACVALTINGFDNWHLPSEAESYEMYKNLHLNGLGNFNLDKIYWSSTEHSGNTVTTIDFNNGAQGWLCKQCNEVTSLRAVRYF